MNKLAILQMCDGPQVECSRYMLEAVGWRVKVCGSDVRDALKKAGCDTVNPLARMADFGDEAVDVEEASLRELETCDLFVDIKCRNLPKVWDAFPPLRYRSAWWRINGGQPEMSEAGGDEVNLLCPLITANLWYGTAKCRDGSRQSRSDVEHAMNGPACDPGPTRVGDNGMAYVMWPPYPKKAVYEAIDRSGWPPEQGYEAPYCSCHNVRGLGYGHIVDDVMRLGVRLFGNGSPAGQVDHSRMAHLAGRSLCLVHLKSLDCAGLALFEAMLSGCPVVVGRLFLSRTLDHELLVDGETCLQFGIPATMDYGRGDMDFPKCVADIRAALERLANPAENRRIGEAGRKRLRELLWTPERDGPGFAAFMGRHFGG